MLYLIVPPIIIVLALVVLLFLLSRKGPEFSKQGKKARESGGHELGITEKNKRIRFSRLKHFFLNLLEKITRRLKYFFLKTHNMAERWISIIKEKRKRNIPGTVSEDAEKKEAVAIDKKPDVVKISPPPAEKIFLEKKPIAPMISEDMTQPEQRSETKGEYEKILIERIAGNPRDLEAYERLGKYYMEQNNYRDAKECYKQVLKLSPVNRQAKIRLNKISRLLGR